MTQEEYPKIRKAIFIVDKDRRYSFDVDQNISIYNLKKMIMAAANLGKAGLRIFHEGKEYTKNNDDSLDFLFPTLDVVIFTLTISYDSIEEYDELIKLKLCQKYCSLHSNKYPYFYCYKCNKSICYECILSGNHKDHEYKEKYDYLQSSRILTEELFKNLKDNLKNIDEKLILELKDKITVKFFPSLVKIVKEIENKLILLIETFIKKEKNNFNLVKNNMISLKRNCEDGLDCLKDKICIEDMMIDEEIFLIFDKKFKNIGEEKKKILKDVEEYNQFKLQLKILGDAVEKVYNELYAILDKYLTSDIYTKISKEIEKFDVIPLKRKEIFSNLLSDIKKKSKIYKATALKVNKN